MVHHPFSGCVAGSAAAVTDGHDGAPKAAPTMVKGCHTLSAGLHVRAMHAPAAAAEALQRTQSKARGRSAWA
jgi:hypothetical protein